ncbi:hypothetical protein ACWCYC_40175, partial [Streptomyces phaeofaciens]
MSGLGELDRPGTPESGGAWDARSAEWAVGEGGAGSGVHAGARAGPNSAQHTQGSQPVSPRSPVSMAQPTT